jgi:hypothetical protein
LSSTRSLAAPRLRAVRAVLAVLALTTVFAAASGCQQGADRSRSSATSAPPIASGDPWTAAQLVRPAQLAGELAADSAARPMLVHVGFQVLYRGGAIPGSRYLGPGQRPEGIAALQAAMKDEPRGRDIVIYCGCCPWDHCPNMRAAFRALSGMGFQHVRALYVARNLDDDWVAKGYPIAKPVE